MGDALAFQAIKDAVKEGAAAFNAELATVSKEEMYVEAEALGAWAVADVERDNLNKLAAVKQDAQWTLQQAETAEAEALDAVAKNQEAVRKAFANQSFAEEKVKELQENVAEAFERLKVPKEPVADISPAKDLQQPVAMEDVDAPMEDAEVIGGIETTAVPA